MGAQAFAERARRELVATGEKVQSRTVGSPGELTGQEGQIARLAADGLTNQEIGAQLFISRHTVEWHLRKVFAKLGISSSSAPHAHVGRRRANVKPWSSTRPLDSRECCFARPARRYPGTFARMFVITMSGTDSVNAQNVTSTRTADLRR